MQICLNISSSSVSTTSNVLSVRLKKGPSCLYNETVVGVPLIRLCSSATHWHPGPIAETHTSYPLVDDHEEAYRCVNDVDCCDIFLPRPSGGRETRQKLSQMPVTHLQVWDKSELGGGLTALWPTADACVLWLYLFSRAENISAQRGALAPIKWYNLGGIEIIHTTAIHSNCMFWSNVPFWHSQNGMFRLHFIGAGRGENIFQIINDTKPFSRPSFR